MTKRCYGCQLIKPLTDFNKHSGRPDGHQAQCRACQKVANRERYIADPTKHREAVERYRAKNPAGFLEKRRQWDRRKKYGLSPEAYEVMITAQQGQCAICRTTPDKVLRVDHDHRTGTIRGLLCDSCNKGLGNFNDNAQTLIAAAEYLAFERPIKSEKIDGASVTVGPERAHEQR